VVYLPPFARSLQETIARLPSVLDRYSTAVINYRWAESMSSSSSNGRDDGLDSADTSKLPSLYWPFAVHDVAFGYEWIIKNLAPLGQKRRDIYVVGSYLGASLAGSLALTETHPHERMAVRKLCAYNGIYNWTTFLPDHPINKIKDVQLSDLAISDNVDFKFHHLEQQISSLFASPAGLFDPFASPCLFFHSAGLHVPPNFTTTSIPHSLQEAIDTLSSGSPIGDVNMGEPESKAPRKGYLAFPPRQSSLKIPEALFLHDTPPLAIKRRTRRDTTTRSGRSKENSFAAQADELAGLMRRSINKLELKDRRKWDEDFDAWEDEADNRVRVADVGKSRESFDLNDTVQDNMRAWIEGD
jgi:hypothetical protein